MAQDFHFSQFFVLPAFLNPAYIGKFRTDYRIGLIQRRQWIQLNTPYVTSGATAEINFRLGPLKYDLVGVGLSFVNDELGKDESGRIFNNQHIIASGAYHKYLDEFLRHRISGGIQVSYVRKNVNLGNQTFANQLDGYKFNIGKPSFENTSLNPQHYANINIGVAYNFKVSQKFEFETGLSFFNVGSPKESVSGSDYKLPVRFVWNAMLSFKFSENISLTPNLLYMNQGQASDLVAGALVGYHFNHRRKPVLYLGSYYRYQESIIPTAGFAYNNFYFGISYDLVNSGPKNMMTDVPALKRQDLGSLEFTLIYNGFLKRAIPGKITIPCGYL